ncbi:hypothetical protein B0H13DRAFT_1867539 [Mycena leptocephala]|nr:hypothetical protein B0H13DRAFT_1867539 [Mycena leptocephala]
MSQFFPFLFVLLPGCQLKRGSKGFTAAAASSMITETVSCAFHGSVEEHVQSLSGNWRGQVKSSLGNEVNNSSEEDIILQTCRRHVTVTRRLRIRYRHWKFDHNKSFASVKSGLCKMKRSISGDSRAEVSKRSRTLIHPSLLGPDRFGATSGAPQQTKHAQVGSGKDTDFKEEAEKGKPMPIVRDISAYRH